MICVPTKIKKLIRLAHCRQTKFVVVTLFAYFCIMAHKPN